MPHVLEASSLAAAMLLLSGCISTHQAFERNASESGLERSEVKGLGFRHALYSKPVPERADAGPVHVYLTGDGRPYVRPNLASGDPTPRHPVVPGLLAIDPRPGIILGRPCYHGYAAINRELDRSLQRSCEPASAGTSDNAGVIGHEFLRNFPCSAFYIKPIM